MFRFLILLFSATPLFALEPANIAIVANKDMPESISVAKYYSNKRNVPEENIILLSLPKGEDILRADFESNLAEPLRKALNLKKDKIKVILTVYGVPFRVGTKILSGDEKVKADEIKKQLDDSRKELEIAEKDKAEKDKLDGFKKKIAEIELKKICDDEEHPYARRAESEQDLIKVIRNIDEGKKQEKKEKQINEQDL